MKKTIWICTADESGIEYFLPFKDVYKKQLLGTLSYSVHKNINRGAYMRTISLTLEESDEILLLIDKGHWRKAELKLKLKPDIPENEIGKLIAKMTEVRKWKNKNQKIK